MTYSAHLNWPLARNAYNWGRRTAPALWGAMITRAAPGCVRIVRKRTRGSGAYRIASSIPLGLRRFPEGGTKRRRILASTTLLTSDTAGIYAPYAGYYQ